MNSYVLFVGLFLHNVPPGVVKLAMYRNIATFSIILLQQIAESHLLAE